MNFENRSAFGEFDLCSGIFFNSQCIAYYYWPDGADTPRRASTVTSR